MLTAEGAAPDPFFPSRLAFLQSLPWLSKFLPRALPCCRLQQVEYEQGKTPRESPLSISPVPSPQTLINLPPKSLPGQSPPGCSSPGPNLPHQPAVTATHRHAPSPRAPPCRVTPTCPARTYAEGLQSRSAVSPVQLITRAINQWDKELQVRNHRCNQRWGQLMAAAKVHSGTQSHATGAELSSLPGLPPQPRGSSLALGAPSRAGDPLLSAPQAAKLVSCRSFPPTP